MVLKASGDGDEERRKASGDEDGDDVGDQEDEDDDDSAVKRALCELRRVIASQAAEHRAALGGAQGAGEQEAACQCVRIGAVSVRLYVGRRFRKVR